MQNLPKVFDVVWFIHKSKVVTGKILSVVQSASRNETKVHTVITLQHMEELFEKKLADVSSTKEELMVHLFGNISRVSEAERACQDIANDFDDQEIHKQTTSVQIAWNLGTQFNNAMEVIYD